MPRDEVIALLRQLEDEVRKDLQDAGYTEQDTRIVPKLLRAAIEEWYDDIAATLYDLVENEIMANG